MINGHGNQANEKKRDGDNKVYYRKDGSVRHPRCDGLFEDLPEWAKDNENIKSGYRIDYEGTREVVGTLCKCHNETVNIWTHLIGSLVMLTAGILFLVYFEDVSTVAQKGWTAYETKLRTQSPNLELPNYILE